MSRKSVPAQIPYVHPDDPANHLKPGEAFVVDGLDWSWAFVAYKPIPGFPGYCVGTNGTVWSAWISRGTIGVRGGGRVISDGWKKLRHGFARQYFKVAISQNGRSVTRLIHHLVLEVFVGKRPVGLDGCHYDDDPANNRLWNLRWDTKTNNQADAIRNGRRPWGEGHKRSKLTASEVRHIRSAYASGEMNQPQLAAKFGVGQNQISRIILRLLWVHLV